MPNFGTEPMYGYQPLPGTTQAPLWKISGIEAPAEELAVDPDLPVLSSLFTNDRVEEVVIPKHRFVGMVDRAIAANMATYKPYLTLAGPRKTDADPIGFASFDLYKEYTNRTQGMGSAYERQGYITYPFVNGEINGEYGFYNSNLVGALYEGAPLAPDAYGRPTLFTPARTVTQVATVTVAAGAGATVLTAATVKNLPVEDVVVNNITQGLVVSTAKYSTAWSSGDAAWKITFASLTGAGNITTGDVVVISYTYGHAPQKRVGQVGRLKTGKDINSLAGYLSRQMKVDFPFAPMIIPMVTTTATDTITLTNAMKATDMTRSFVVSLSHTFVDPTRTILVEYAGDGSTYVTFTNLEQTLMYPGQELGAQFAINPVSGKLHLYLDSSDSYTTAVSKVRVTYSYEVAQPRHELGRLGNLGRGIEYLTDGTYTGGQTATKPAFALHEDGNGLRTSAWAEGVTGDLTKCGFMHILFE